MRKRSLIHRLSFRSSGKPRGWLRAILLQDQVLGIPRATTRRLLFTQSGQVRSQYRNWYSRFEASPDNAVLFEYAQFLRAQLAVGTNARARTLCVVTTPHTAYLAEAIASALADTRLIVSAVTEMPRHFAHDLYVVVAPQMFDTMPPPERTIIYQVEQVRASRWVDFGYLARLRNSLAVLDYSTDNITALIERGMVLKQLYYVPIQPTSQPDAAQTRDIDVLFYGATGGSDRRDRYLNALSKWLNIRVENNLFGSQIKALLDRTKVVVNVHFYENAVLETTRISEALSHGAHVVSETAIDQSSRSDFAAYVDFVAVGDVDAFIARVEASLAAWSAPQHAPRRGDVNSTAFLLLRAMHGIGVLSFDEFTAATQHVDLPGQYVVLGLPEQAERAASARAHLLDGAGVFPGLRHVDGWRGCAQSYKYLASKAISKGLPQLLIYEDDAVFAPDIGARLSGALAYLDSLAGDWDVFSGLLSDLDSEATISAVVRFQDQEFIHLNSVIGMVFGIYNHTALNLLSKFEYAGNDMAKHTIDRFIEAQNLRCVTTLPPLANHSHALESTLWLIHNDMLTTMITKSIARLEAKRHVFLTGKST